MTAQALNSLRRTGKEIVGMSLLAVLALSCVAAVHQKIEKRLDSNTARVAQTTFAEEPLPIPEEPAPPVMVMITSPQDGIFQAGKFNGGPALVSVGTEVTAGTKVGAVQPRDSTALPILAGVTGTVKEILVKDQQMVMAGQALMKIKPQQMPESPAE